MTGTYTRGATSFALFIIIISVMFGLFGLALLMADAGEFKPWLIISMSIFGLVFGLAFGLLAEISQTLTDMLDNMVEGPEFPRPEIVWPDADDDTDPRLRGDHSGAQV